MAELMGRKVLVPQQSPAWGCWGKLWWDIPRQLWAHAGNLEGKVEVVVFYVVMLSP